MGLYDILASLGMLGAIVGLFYFVFKKGKRRQGLAAFIGSLLVLVYGATQSVDQRAREAGFASAKDQRLAAAEGVADPKGLEANSDELPKAVAAECTVWEIEDSSAGEQKRERVFVSTSTEDATTALEIATGYASRRAAANGLDFIDVFLTRSQDGTNRSDHSLASSLAHVRYNPGGTPVTDSRIEADIVNDPKGLRFENGMVLDGERFPERSRLDEAAIDQRVDRSSAAYVDRCKSE